MATMMMATATSSSIAHGNSAGHAGGMSMSMRDRRAQAASSEEEEVEEEGKKEVGEDGQHHHGADDIFARTQRVLEEVRAAQQRAAVFGGGGGCVSTLTRSGGSGGGGIDVDHAASAGGPFALQQALGRQWRRLELGDSEVQQQRAMQQQRAALPVQSATTRSAQANSIGQAGASPLLIGKADDSASVVPSSSSWPSLQGADAVGSISQNGSDDIEEFEFSQPGPGENGKRQGGRQKTTSKKKKKRSASASVSARAGNKRPKNNHFTATGRGGGGHSNSKEDDDEPLHTDKPVRETEPEPTKQELETEHKPATEPEELKEPPKPKRPLSAYNLFFRHERSRLLTYQTDHPHATLDETLRNLPPLETTVNVVDCQYLDTLRNSIESLLTHNPHHTNRQTRSHRKSHGKFNFTELVQAISNLWNRCHADVKSIFQELADEGRVIYKKELADWKRRVREEEKRRQGKGGEVIKDGKVRGVTKKEQVKLKQARRKTTSKEDASCKEEGYAQASTIAFGTFTSPIHNDDTACTDKDDETTIEDAASASSSLSSTHIGKEDEQGDKKDQGGADDDTTNNNSNSNSNRTNNNSKIMLQTALDLAHLLPPQPQPKQQHNMGMGPQQQFLFRQQQFLLKNSMLSERHSANDSAAAAADNSTGGGQTPFSSSLDERAFPPPNYLLGHVGSMSGSSSNSYGVCGSIPIPFAAAGNFAAPNADFNGCNSVSHSCTNSNVGTSSSVDAHASLFHAVGNKQAEQRPYELGAPLGTGTTARAARAGWCLGLANSNSIEHGGQQAWNPHSDPNPSTIIATTTATTATCTSALLPPPRNAGSNGRGGNGNSNKVGVDPDLFDFMSELDWAKVQ